MAALVGLVVLFLLHTLVFGEATAGKCTLERLPVPVRPAPGARLAATPGTMIATNYGKRDPWSVADRPVTGGGLRSRL